MSGSDPIREFFDREYGHFDRLAEAKRLLLLSLTVASLAVGLATRDGSARATPDQVRDHARVTLATLQGEIAEGHTLSILNGTVYCPDFGMYFVNPVYRDGTLFGSGQDGTAYAATMNSCSAPEAGVAAITNTPVGGVVQFHFSPTDSNQPNVGNGKLLLTDGAELTVPVGLAIPAAQYTAARP